MKFKITTAVLLSLISISVNAAILQGKINTLVSNLEEVFGVDSDYLLIEGESAAGTCPTSAGLVIVRISDSGSRMFSMALAAQLAGREIAVDVLQGFTGAGGACTARWLKIIN